MVYAIIKKMTIDSKTIAARKISAHFASIKNAIIIAPKTMNGERSKRRNTRLTPFWTVLVSFVIRVISEDVPRLSSSLNESV